MWSRRPGSMRTWPPLPTGPTWQWLSKNENGKGKRVVGCAEGFEDGLNGENRGPLGRKLLSFFYYFFYSFSNSKLQL